MYIREDSRSRSSVNKQVEPPEYEPPYFLMIRTLLIHLLYHDLGYDCPFCYKPNSSNLFLNLHKLSHNSFPKILSNQSML